MSNDKLYKFSNGNMTHCGNMSEMIHWKQMVT